MPVADIRPDRPDEITVTTDYTDRERMLLIPGGLYKRDGTWMAPLSWATCRILRGVFGEDLKVTPDLKAWAQRERKLIDHMMELRSLLEPPDAMSKGNKLIDEIESSSTMKLKPYQRVTLACNVVMGQFADLSEMGTGKTGVAIRTLQVLHAAGRQPFPAVIVAPKSVVATTWPTELGKWAPELSYTIISGDFAIAERRKRIAQRNDVTIITWEMVRAHSRVSGYGSIRLTDTDTKVKELNELAPRTVIMDEAGRLREPQSAQSRAVKWLAHQARYRYALTGTPVNNDDAALEMWGILHVIAPEWHPHKTKYDERYVLSGYSLFGGRVVMGLEPGYEPEFRSITLPLYRRVLKDMVLQDLPQRLPDITRHTPMTPRQAKIYRQMEDLQIAQLNDLLVAKTPLVALTRLMQFAAASARIEERVDSKGQVHRDVMLEDPSNKVDDLVELLDEMGDEPLVVAAESAKLIDLAEFRLNSLGITCAVIAGRVGLADRALAVQRFQAGEVRVILLVLKTGAEGITLTRSRVILFMQESWEPEENDQAVGRIDRIGAEVHASLQVIRQITPGTVEERKPKVLARKGRRIEEVLQDKAALAAILGADEKRPKVRGTRKERE